MLAKGFSRQFQAGLCNIFSRSKMRMEAVRRGKGLVEAEGNVTIDERVLGILRKNGWILVEIPSKTAGNEVRNHAEMNIGKTNLY